MCSNEILYAAGSAGTRAPASAGRIAYLIDQSHNVEGKIEPVLLSVVNIHTAYAKALLVDRRTLARRQAAGDVLGAHQILLDAYQADVRPLLRMAREALRAPADPIETFRREGHAERLAKARGVQAAGAGYPGA